MATSGLWVKSALFPEEILSNNNNEKYFELGVTQKLTNENIIIFSFASQSDAG